MRDFVLQEEIQAIVERIAFYQKKNAWSKKQLAHRAGVAPTSVYEWFKYGRCPSLESIISICQACEISLYEFFAGNQPERRSANLQEINEILSNLSEKHLEAVLNFLKNVIK